MISNQKIISSILFLFVLAGNVFSQSKQDYVWLFGHDSRLIPGIESYLFDFNIRSVHDSVRGLLPIEFSGSNASLCDEEGKLLLYSNGCHIVGADHNILPNGSGLNDGPYLEEFRNDTCDFYRTRQDLLILPDPERNYIYHTIHKRLEHDGNIYIDNILATTVDIRLNGGFGEVINKQVDIIDSTRLLSRYLTAIHHENGKDWWIINPTDRSNQFVRILLDETGFHQLDNQTIDHTFHWNASSSGTSRFSNDGTKYTFFNKDDNLLLFDFDRSSGLLSNLKKLNIVEGLPTIGYFSAVEWSANSRFLYVCIYDELWQIDTWEEDLADGLELIDTWNGVEDPFQTTFYLMSLAPDCRIYMCSGSSTNTYNVINKPDEKGKACDFVQQGVRLPFVSARGNLPFFPRFRVDEEEKCDPTITTFLGDAVYFRRDLEVYPNPSIDNINISVPDNQKGSLYIFDSNGRNVGLTRTINYEQSVSIDISVLPSGMYSVEFLPENQKDRIIYTAWVNKVKM